MASKHPSRENRIERAAVYLCEHATEEEAGIIVGRLFKRHHAYGLILVPCAPEEGDVKPGIAPVYWGEYHAVLGMMHDAFENWSDITAEDAGESEAGDGGGEDQAEG